MIQVKGSEDAFNYFTNDVLMAFVEVIQKNTHDFLKENPNPLPAMLGCFILKDVPKICGETTNVYIEYDVKILAPFKLLEAGFQKIVLFDEVEDYILDRYNLKMGWLMTKN